MRAAVPCALPSALNSRRPPSHILLRTPRLPVPLCPAVVLATSFAACRSATRPLGLPPCGIFRLWLDEDEIPWNKIAQFNYRDGIFWDMFAM